MAPVGRDGRIITFYSYKGGVGRTMALANVAWILAGSGRKVLAVDWDLESPGLHRYFHPFLVDKQLRDSVGVIDAMRDFAELGTRPSGHDTQIELDLAEVERVARVERYATSLDRYDFPAGGSIDLLPAGRQVPAYSKVVSTFNWDHFYERLGGGVFLDALGKDMRRHYDVILIDSRTGLSDNAGICTVQLPDTVVSCFTMSTQSIDGAAAVAKSIAGLSQQTIRIVPVPTRVEDGELSKLERSRTYARQRFDPFVRALGESDVEKYWGRVEIPYKIFYAYEETLAAFGDRPSQENSLLAAYERLAGELMDEQLEWTPPTESVRRSWLAEFERRAPTEPSPVVIVYAPRDRMWAEWIAAELRGVGQPFGLRKIADAHRHTDGDRMLMLLSQDLMRSAEAGEVWRKVTALEGPGPGRLLVPIRLDGTALTAPFDLRMPVDLFNLSAAGARQELLNALELPDVAAVVDPPGEARNRPRFPDTLVPVWRAPSRNLFFTGRDDLLESLREQLSPSVTSGAPVALVGMGGVGKTQIAIEYVHRFAADYDVVWWISADQPALVRTALGELATILNLPAGSETTDQANAALDALRKGSPSPRWLVVFDNADDPAQLREFIPTGPGDVIITSLAQSWSRETHGMDVRVFDRAESVELLSRRVDRLPVAQAAEIAERLGDLPLAVEQAAAWLSATAMTGNEYLGLLDEHLPRVLNEHPPPGYPHPAAASWRLSLERLRELNPAAARLLELCAFFAPEPIPTRLLSSPGMIDALVGYDPSLRDPLLHGALVRDIGRYGLARVDPAVNGVRIHRLVQRVIGEDLSPEVRRASSVQVQKILAEERRGSPDDRENWPTYHALRPHLEPTGTLDSADPEVRQLIVDMVRYLRVRGDLSGAQELGERAVERWSRHGQDDDFQLRVRFELANLLRERGEYDESTRIDQDLHERFGRIFGANHLYTLMASRGLAADLRGQGHYRQACELDRRTLEQFRASFGDDHEGTLMASNNLSVSETLVGDFASALSRARDTFQRQERVRGPRHHTTLIFGGNWGRGLREMGDLLGSRRRLEITQATSQESLGPHHTVTLRAGKSLAVTLRRLGRLTDAHTLTAETLERYDRQLGRRHPHAMACELELACVLSALGKHDEAHRIAADLVVHYRQGSGPEHPFTLAAENNLAIFDMRAGEHERARPVIESVAAGMSRVLGPEHPYTLVCQMNLGNVRFSLGDADGALRIDERTHTLLRSQFGGDHPTALAAAANLAHSLRATGAVRHAETRLTETLRLAQRVLGEDHPNTVAIDQGTRINTDIEPPPT